MRLLFLTRALHWLVVWALLWGQPAPGGARPGGWGSRPEGAGWYRAWVQAPNAPARARLAGLGAAMLQRRGAAALVLADAGQLAALARLGFAPRGVEALPADLAAGALTQPGAAGWAALAAWPLQDGDGDGLSDTEEGWWCTNPANPDSDADTVSDGQEVAQLLAGNRTHGKPFLGWPPTIPGCYDDDFDSIPDQAETNIIGLSSNRESSDLDKYDDGQEFFGSTYCPGGPGSCGYGALPRTADLYLGSNMPAFVRAPANSPFVAAFPDPVVTVVDGSLNVEAVTTITTDHTITTGESHFYSTATTRGVSTSQVDLQTWNDWQEVAVVSGTQRARLDPVFNHRPHEPEGLDNLLAISGETVAIVSTLGWLGGIACGASVVCGVAVVAAGVVALGAYGLSVVRELDDAGVFDAETTPDEVQLATQANRCSQAGPGNFTCMPDDVVTQQAQDLVDLLGAYGESQDRGTGGSAVNYEVTADSSLNTAETSAGQAPLAAGGQPDLGQVRQAVENGGVQGTITTEYNETTITEGYEFSSAEAWSEATAVNSAHAADLRFTYQVTNDGTDILRVMDGLLFNIYLGNDPNPIYTYNVIAQTGTLSNLQPGQSVTLAANPTPLSLQQMARLDQGAALLVTVEHLSYGGDQIFFEDAVSGGVIVGLDDGWEDGDETLDLVVLPCFGNPCGVDPDEALQTVLQRGFPTQEDARGNLVAIATPEVNGTQVTWVEHPLSYTSWWNIYFSPNIAYSGAFSTTRPAAGAAVVLRILTDRDLDGFNDRTEERLGADPEDAADTPRPELLAGALVERDGNQATVTLAFLNNGAYDASGVQAAAYAPDDSITLTDHVIGGSGRVGAGSQVIVSSRIGAPVLGSGWSGSARPAAGGQFSGAVDRTYTFTALASGNIGSGSLPFSWTDGVQSGQLQFGASYQAPRPLAVGEEGVTISFDSGAVTVGNAFTVRARPAGDTIRYTINREPYTPPVLVIAYNDPQGNHRFVTPVTLASLTEDLGRYAGQMLDNLDLSVSAPAALAPGSNQLYFTTNSPADQPLADAHLFVEYLVDGVAVAEQVYTQTLQPGPTLWPVTWDPASLAGAAEAADAAAPEYSLLAFWTDAQGNIIDTVYRPLASFQADPLGELRATATAWDFGAVYQGTALYRELVAANVGQGWLPAMQAPAGLAGQRLGEYWQVLAPVQSAHAGFLLDTAQPGPLNGQILVRSGDLTSGTLAIPVTGTVLPIPNLQMDDADLTFSTPNPLPGQLFTIQATVHNTSTYAVAGVVVRFYAGATPIGADQLLPSIPPGGTGTAQIGYTYQAGQNLIQAVANPDQTIPETCAWDNTGRGFLNIGSTLPPDGILSGGQVVRITDPGQLITPSIQVLDGAALILQNITATLDTLTLGAEATLLLDHARLNLTHLAQTGALSATLAAADNQSALTVATPYTLTAQTIDLRLATFQSLGAPGANGGPGLAGAPGSPAGLTLAANRLTLAGAVLLAQGGGGGGGGNSSNNGGSGGPGGLASLHLQAAQVAYLDQTVLTAQAGAGGPGGDGGSDAGEYGGNGGLGGPAHLALAAPRLSLWGGLLAAQAGAGGAGGTARNGGEGASGGAADLQVTAASLNSTGTGYQAGAGQGGAGGEGDGNDGGAAAAGGAASLTFEAGEAVLTGGQVVGQGGAGGNGAYGDDNASGAGDGGPATLNLAGARLELAAATLALNGGAGGAGGYGYGSDGVGVGGRGGWGGTADLMAAVDWLASEQITLTLNGGPGGAGGAARTRGGPGGLGGGASQIFTLTQWTVETTLLASLGGAGGSGGPAFGASSSQDEDGGAGGQGGNAEVQMTAQTLALTGGTYRLQPGDGGDGGAGGPQGADRGGAGGAGGALVFGGATELAWEASELVWETALGQGGAPGGGGIPGLPGAVGAQQIDAANGYQLAVYGTRSYRVTELRPGLAEVKGLAGLSVDWDGGVTQTVTTSSLLPAPVTLGLHWLNLHLVYTDTTTAESQHRFYVYNVTSDYDADGLPDRAELSCYGTNPFLADTDGDGLPDQAETVARVDPLNPDSDYDGTPDGLDAEVLLDPDLTPAAPQASNSTPTEGETITLVAQVSNLGSNQAGGLVAAFFAGDPTLPGSRYLCADFISDLAPGGAAPAACAWTTTGFTGSQQIYVWVDPLDRLVETVETNNLATASLTVLTKPDLQITALGLANDLEAQLTEVRQGETVTVNVTVYNAGQTDAPASTLALYAGSALTGTLALTATVALPAGAGQTLALPWSATVLGAQQLTAQADSTQLVAEAQEANNQTQTAFYVGWGAPLYLDAGGASDPAYLPNLGYGYLTAGAVVNSCGGEAYQTYRQRNSGELLQYRFDHLLPSHFYHLDLSFFLCAGTRDLRVLVDGVELANPVTANQTPNYQSLRLEPSLYADHSIVISIEKVGGGLGGPVVSELKLTDIRYCYRDSGHPDEPAYAGAADGCGWLDGVPDQSWGLAPDQSVRYDDGSSVQYRFDRLQAGQSYNLNFTFYENDAFGRVESVQVDGQTVLAGVALSNTPQFLTVSVPTNTYASDSWILVEIGAPLQPVISEAAVEEQTVFPTGLEPNLPPSAAPNSYTTVQDTRLVVPAPGVLDNDSDPNDDLLTAHLVSATVHGALAFSPTGGFVYTPTLGYVGVDSFTYQASDGQALSMPVSVTITVSARPQQTVYLPLVVRFYPPP